MRFPEFPVHLPDLETQKRIGDLLTAYDDLIENNRRRIKLLEEAARLIYREWFVRLRFPGHETTKIVDGIPEGWSRAPFSAIADFLNGYAFRPEQLLDHGLPIIKIPELKEGITSKTPYNPGDHIPAKYRVEDGDLLFSWSGTLAVNFWAGSSGLLNQHLFKVTPSGDCSSGFLLLALKAAMESFSNVSTGATMQHIRRSALDSTLTLVGTAKIMSDFAALVEPIFHQIRILRKANISLVRARDLLLPRLMSGELDL